MTNNCCSVPLHKPTTPLATVTHPTSGCLLVLRGGLGGQRRSSSTATPIKEERIKHDEGAFVAILIHFSLQQPLGVKQSAVPINPIRGPRYRPLPRDRAFDYYGSIKGKGLY
jgi:hypothetical protein